MQTLSLLKYVRRRRLVKVPDSDCDRCRSVVALECSVSLIWKITLYPSMPVDGAWRSDTMNDVQEPQMHPVRIMFVVHTQTLLAKSGLHRPTAELAPIDSASMAGNIAVPRWCDRLAAAIAMRVHRPHAL